MNQQTISETLSAADLQAMDAAVTMLELQFVGLLKHLGEQRRLRASNADADAEPPPLSVPDATMDALNAALDTLEAQFDKTVRLSDEGRRRLPKLDAKSEAFCRETLALLAHNRDRLPPDFDIDAALEQLRAYDTVRQIKARLGRLGRIFSA